MKNNYQQLQREFCYRLRQKDAPIPKNIAPSEMKIYENIFFNNMDERLSHCFPVLSSILTQKNWQQLIHDFISEHAARTPLFHEIPQEFLHYLINRSPQETDLPFLLELAHFEWMELVLFTAKNVLIKATLSHELDWKKTSFKLIQPAEIVAYYFPVHQINLHFIPMKASKIPFYLCLYRHRDGEIKYLELNPVAARLLHIFQQTPCTGYQALKQIAKEQQYINVEKFIEENQSQIQQWLEAGILQVI